MLQFSIRITFGGAPRDLTKSIKSESAVTIVNPLAPAYSQIDASEVDRAKTCVENMSRIGEKVRKTANELRRKIRVK
jgi:hypothetical protein